MWKKTSMVRNATPTHEFYYILNPNKKYENSIYVSVISLSDTIYDFVHTFKNFSMFLKILFITFLLALILEKIYYDNLMKYLCTFYFYLLVAIKRKKV